MERGWLAAAAGFDHRGASPVPERRAPGSAATAAALPPGIYALLLGGGTSHSWHYSDAHAFTADGRFFLEESHPNRAGSCGL